MRATTTALVRDLDVSLDDVRLAVEGYYVAAGMGPDVIGAAEFAELVAETVEEMVDIAPCLPVGAVVGRRLDHLVVALRAQRGRGAVNRRGPEPGRFWASPVQRSSRVRRRPSTARGGPSCRRSSCAPA